VPVLSLLRVLLPHVVRHYKASAACRVLRAASDKDDGKLPV